MSAVSGVSNNREAVMPQAKLPASKPASQQQLISTMFQKIDKDGTGSVSKAQFAQAFESLGAPASIKAMGADAVFAKLDPSGTGKVSKQDFVKGMESLMAQGGVTKVAAKPSAPAAAPAAPVATASNIASVGGGSVGNTINVTA
jgi:hypothetical protein